MAGHSQVKAHPQAFESVPVPVLDRLMSAPFDDLRKLSLDLKRRIDEAKRRNNSPLNPVFSGQDNEHHVATTPAKSSR
jgi:hypothetical protein